jgi:hypothetical protein
MQDDATGARFLVFVASEHGTSQAPSGEHGGFVMTPLAGLIIAVIAGWIVADPRRAAAAVIVPFLAVLGAQSARIAAGDGTSPPSTVISFPQAIGYWVIQAIFLALALGIAAELGALRGRGRPDATAAEAGRRAVIVSGVLAVPAAVFVTFYLLESSPVLHHAASGSPPAQGFIGVALCIVTFGTLSVLIFRGRRATAELTGAAASTAATGRRR